jgi:LysM repeat protein
MSYQTYTVRGGDSLSKIAQRLGISNWRDLYNLNKSLIGANPNYIRPGQVLNIPGTQAQKAAPTPAAPTASAGATAGQSAAPKRVADFATEVMPFEQFWDPNLARSAIAQRTASYFDPQAQRGREGIESDFASRGLTRSSQRGRGVMDMYRDMADKEQTMREQLYGGIQGQAKEDWGFQQKLYEDRPDEYQKSTFDKSNYEYQFPEESPQKYAQSYRQWLRSTYNI